MEESGEAVCTIHLTGVFRVESPTGADITPASELRCALLAVLASSPNLSRSRSYLKAMFWGNSTGQQASGSLRSALFQLRKDFVGVDAQLIETHRSHISLGSDFWRISKNPNQGIFLEGMDLNLKGADDFEDWLRDARMSGDAGDEETHVLPLQRGPELAGGGGFTLGVLPVQFMSGGNQSLAVTEAALDTLIGLLAQLSAMPIFDLRGTTLVTGALDAQHKAGHQSLLLKSVVYEADPLDQLRLSLVEPRTGRVIAAAEPIPLEADRIDADLVPVAELILGFSLKHLGDAQPVNLMPWAALSSLFSVDPNAVSATESEIDRQIQNAPTPTLHCLKVFLQIFKDNEGLGDQHIYDVSDLQSTLEKVPTIDPLRPLCESLIGYSAHMLCADNDLSEFLLETSRKRAPNLALNLDHLSVLQFARGDLKSAVKHHEQCMRFSTLSSWRYSYDITGAMIAMALGDYRTALRRSNQSLMQRPRFVGALRYTMIGLAMNQHPDSAQLMKSRIVKLRPQYDLPGWIESFMRRSDPAFANNVAITLQRQGLI